MIISKINTEIETFCMDSDFRQSYPLIVFWGRGYDLGTKLCFRFIVLVISNFRIKKSGIGNGFATSELR